jgi:hypothetical protein
MLLMPCFVRLHAPAHGHNFVRLKAQQRRQAGSVDVAIEQPHRVPFARQPHREIHRDGALAHAPLASADCDDVLHARERAAGCCKAWDGPVPRRWIGLLL